LPKPLTTAEIKQVISAIKRTGSHAAAASELGLSANTFAKRIQVIRSRGFEIPNPYRQAGGAREMGSYRQRMRESEKRVIDLEEQIKSMRTAQVRIKPPAPAKKHGTHKGTVRVIFPDLHGSYQDRAAVAAFMADVKILCPDEIIGLGDIFDAGGFLAQHHTWGYVAEAEYTFEDDVAGANGFLDSLQNAAPRARIELLEGNHESRIERWCVTSALRSRKDAKFLLDAYSPQVLLQVGRRGIKYHRRAEFHDGLPVQGAIRRGKICFVHGHTFGQRAAEILARKFATNVVCGHTHKVQSVMISSVAAGTIGAWTMGCLSQRQPLWQHGAPTEWVHAYGIQLLSKSGEFLHLTVPIINGVSLLPEMKLR